MKDGLELDEPAAGGDGPRAKPGLADRVYHLLYSRISNGDYPANQKLPSEKTLADEFGVSRPILRMALERLRDQGIIHSRQGAGSYVREIPHGATWLRAGRDDRRHPALLRVPHLHRDYVGTAGIGAAR